ncbi:MAG: biopolymer transporter ExbD [Desulfobacterales bacterium]|nr:biopolymer transporter ExbD [Desulfobacterales bacterium]
MKIRVPTRKRVRIEMILMDMLFLLLVFFMFAMLSMTVHRGLPVHLPASGPGRPHKDTPCPSPSRWDGSVFVDPHGGGAPGPDRRPEGSGPGRTLRACCFSPTAALLPNLFEVLDRIRAAGLTRVSLQAEPGPSP